MELRIQKLHPNAKVPVVATEGSAGMDLCACLDAPLRLPAGERRLIPTGLAIALPGKAYVGLVFARSGLAVKWGVALSNGVGVIDSDYRGEVQVGLINQSREDYRIEPGERIAQLLVMPVCNLAHVLCETLPETERSTGGFGSTGKV